MLVCQSRPQRNPLFLAAWPAASEHPRKLHRQTNVDAELLGERPDRLVVSEELPREEDDIEALLFQDLLREGARVDVSDGADEDLVPDGLLHGDGEGRLVRRRVEVDAEFLLGVQPAGAHVDYVHAVLCQKLREVGGIFNAPGWLVGEDLLEPVMTVQSIIGGASVGASCSAVLAGHT